ncbi:MAG: FAD-linked oxidase C-terminal domain-containing protein [Thermodesulfovibrionales bacterium]
MEGLEGIEFSAEPEDLLAYGFDASGLAGGPACVVWPRSADEAARAVAYARETGMSIVPRGAGTGLTGGSVPGAGAMVMSFEKLARILSVDYENLNVLVEPGVINGRLQRELARRGYFYPPDPASMDFCTIGGNVAENAGGPRALKYGVTRDYVMELEAVLPSGEIITTGVKTHKGVVGYDLTRLLVGSEGTLAIVTKIRLKVLPMPEAVVTLLASFPDVETAGRAVSDTIAAKVIPRTLEFMDRESISAVENYRPTGLPSGAEALLLIELDGAPQAIEAEAGRVVDICRGLGAEVEMAADEEARQRLWQARRALSPALYHLKPTKINEDVVVPRSRLADMLGGLRRLSGETGIKIVNFGHAGDGNIHVNVMVDKGDDEEYRRGAALVREIFAMVLGLGGTISGEHGVGLTKAPYIGMEIKDTELSLMKGIKRLFDPQGILNPGKIWTPEDAQVR